jgi:hypothetical protein
MYVVRSGTSATAAPAPVSVGTTAKTVLSVLGTAATSIALNRVRVSFNSVTATDAPAVVEVGLITALGTVTAFTPVQHSGPTIASVASAGYNATAEPTFNRVLEATYVPLQQGLFEWWYPLGMEIQADPSQGFALRVTAPVTVNCLASLLYSE